MPIYRAATYGNESVTLENAHLRLDVHRRVTGWAWGELFTHTGKCMAVLEHLGELKLQEVAFPLRLEAPTYRREEGAFGQRLVFPVQSMVIHDLVQDTSFERWVKYPPERTLMDGTVSITLRPDAPILDLEYDLQASAILQMNYLRGPWLKVGADSFGAAKHDAILPGVEWLMGDEWSSGTDWFRDPDALRVAPHPNKVAAPLMALSHGGVGIGLAWDPLARVVGAQRYVQPVFASPNFIDRRNNHVLGLMVPSAAWRRAENVTWAEPPYVLGANGRVRFAAEIFMAQGTSLDVLLAWLARHGMPEPPAPRYPLEEALERIARAYDSHLWREGQGFGQVLMFGQERTGSPTEPIFAERYIAEHAGTPLAEGLRHKVAWCRQQSDYQLGEWSRQGESFTAWPRERALEHGRLLLEAQQPDGAYLFDPDGRHYVKDDVLFARIAVEPLGLPGESALDFAVLPAIQLLRLAEATGEHAFLEGARKALDYCLSMERPEGGDYWETPIHSPNLLAAGHAAIAYELGYRALRELRYREKAIYWIRTLLPFTHLWTPRERQMLYNTKPCLCASDWYLANWVRDHVQWEVLLTFALSARLGLDWSAIDPAVDWQRFQKGITVAALRWMIDHEQMEDTTFPEELVASGVLDTTFADAHNTLTGIYGGGPIMPDIIAINLQEVLARERT